MLRVVFRLKARWDNPGPITCLFLTPWNKIRTQTFIAARSFALLDRGFLIASCSPATTGFFVKTS